MPDLSINGWLFGFSSLMLIASFILLSWNGVKALSRILKESLKHSKRHCGELGAHQVLIKYVRGPICS